MNKIWANRLIAGTKTWSEVPAWRKDAIRDILNAMVSNGNLTQEEFDDITAEPEETKSVGTSLDW